MNYKFKNAFTLAEVFSPHQNVIPHLLRYLKRSRTKYAMTHAAFTLAEVLITLGIIGVVSAITLPTLLNSYQRSQYVTSLHKTYNELSQAFVQTISDSKAMTVAETSVGSKDTLGEFFTERYKIITDCGIGGAADCFGPEYKNIDGTVIDVKAKINEDTGMYCAVVANGAAVCLNSVGDIIVDTNGKKEPNIIGRDYFFMIYNADGMISDGCTTTDCRNEIITREACDTVESAVGRGCIARILKDDWEMKY